MIINSVEQFVAQVQSGWMGKVVSIAKIIDNNGGQRESKTSPGQKSPGCNCVGKMAKSKSPAAIELKLDEVRVIPWEEVDRRIQSRYDRGSSFLLLGGKAGGSSAEGSGALRNIIIHVDEETVFDVRGDRLVLLSDEEVIQFKAVH